MANKASKECSRLPAVISPSLNPGVNLGYDGTTLQTMSSIRVGNVKDEGGTSYHVGGVKSFTT